MIWLKRLSLRTQKYHQRGQVTTMPVMQPIGRVKIAEEQGWWTGKTALRILDGTPPADIPVTTNKESKILLNIQLAKRLGITFPMELLEKATFIEEITR